ncbi:TetR family transcriptional regulator C-terminal domain-containing protein [Kitasatospora sp. NBC_01287]|uniref:TetR family transcriptional regulator C-terminal domain-containing protein n=1 Tax=Kitasatospora sp. NBC_01287 TaxID=2903573 RepID=UPI0022552E97|nr:TetR family transcriptional regulator C-terminal domain-containing protein [Kitasatospora sp. NBC_01287]MCX4745904.1 TetR family transcriptional regulator C-terminal domain-containing protein [Kitasatospora sp. NBC_01287]
MSSSVQPKRVRKTPEARRAEIVAAAAAVALTEGLECITMRRMADELAVRPGLISHYFPVAEELVAEAFGSAATAELEELLPADPAAGRPVERLARFFSLTAGERYDGMSRLWLNARHLSRFRDGLRERVGHQEARWRDRLTGVISAGVAAGEFRTEDPAFTAIHLLVVLDGLSAHANTDRGDPSERSAAVANLAVSTAERELRLPAGALRTRPENLRPAPPATD